MAQAVEQKQRFRQSPKRVTANRNTKRSDRPSSDVSGWLLFPPSPGGGQEVAHGYKGKGTLLHLLVDSKGNPIAITTTSAKGDERREVQELLGKIPNVSKQELQERMSVLEADRGYDASWLRQALLVGKCRNYERGRLNISAFDFKVFSDII